MQAIRRSYVRTTVAGSAPRQRAENDTTRATHLVVDILLARGKGGNRLLGRIHCTHTTL